MRKEEIEIIAKKANYFYLKITIIKTLEEEILRIEGDSDIVSDLFGKIKECNSAYCIYEVRIDRRYAYP